MTVPLWLAIVAGVGTLIGGGGLGAVAVAIINAQASAREALPDQLLSALKHEASERERDRQRLDAVEGHLVLLGDHIDVLEAHIWKQLPPPPPARPVYRPMGRSDS